MRVFAAAVVTAIVLATGSAIGMYFSRETSAQAYQTGSARLDQQECVNFYGRAG